MKTLLRWLALLFTLIVARILIAVAILAGVVFLIGQGLHFAGLPIPTAAEVEARLQPALQDLAALRQRMQPPAAASRPTRASPFSPPTHAQSQP